MKNKITGKDILDMVIGKLDPGRTNANGGIPDLLKMISNVPATPLMNIQPTRKAKPQVEATPENIGASLAETKLVRKYNKRDE